MIFSEITKSGNMFYINNTIFSALYELIMFVHIIPSSVWAAEWPPLGEELLTGLSISMFPLFFFLGVSLRKTGLF